MSDSPTGDTNRKTLLIKTTKNIFYIYYYSYMFDVLVVGGGHAGVEQLMHV